jgi:hypothetical protein
VAVEVAACSVIVLGGAGIGVAGEGLRVSQGYSGVKGGGDGSVPQRVQAGDHGALGRDFSFTIPASSQTWIPAQRTSPTAAESTQQHRCRGGGGARPPTGVVEIATTSLERLIDVVQAGPRQPLLQLRSTVRELWRGPVPSGIKVGRPRMTPFERRVSYTACIKVALWSFSPAVALFSATAMMSPDSGR